jgi:hypothetical protein
MFRLQLQADGKLRRVVALDPISGRAVLIPVRSAIVYSMSPAFQWRDRDIRIAATRVGGHVIVKIRVRRHRARKIAA